MAILMNPDGSQTFLDQTKSFVEVQTERELAAAQGTALDSPCGVPVSPLSLVKQTKTEEKGVINEKV